MSDKDKSDKLIVKGFERIYPEKTETEVFFELFKDIRILNNEEFEELKYYPTVEYMYQMFKDRLLAEYPKIIE